ncbi:MAG: methylated-DNA--[protein]-cysteine S-methyltransferase [Lachnospiraceae bacterium]|nr:methylated-DNA--[protein]-cysteine S-methyltransferase [Lachnospiraceae bacterium]
MILKTDEMGLTLLDFVDGCGQQERLRQEGLPDAHEGEEAVVRRAAAWLDAYFAGKRPEEEVPGEAIPLHLVGSEFQKQVWEVLLTIPYGCTMSYGQVAASVAAKRGLLRMSARAVGGAVGSNPISLMVPCHRVLGADGNITGYGGGLDRKRALLALENISYKDTHGPEAARYRKSCLDK